MAVWKLTVWGGNDPTMFLTALRMAGNWLNTAGPGQMVLPTSLWPQMLAKVFSTPNRLT